MRTLNLAAIIAPYPIYLSVYWSRHAGIHLAAYPSGLASVVDTDCGADEHSVGAVVNAGAKR